MIAVTFALPAESSDFIKLLEQRSQAGAVTSGVLHGQHVAVLHTGVGAAMARARVAEFLGSHTPALLISSGFAGALGHELVPGDIVVAENHRPAALMVAQSSGWRVVRLTTADQVLDSAAARGELAASTGAAVVDMETETIAEVCRTNGVPMFSLRGISDTPAAPFPVPPHVLFDVALQRTPYASLLLHLIAHPRAIPKLIAFSRQIATARRALTSALDLLLRRISSG